MSEPAETTGFFRCRVQSDQARAKLRIGHRWVAVTLQETSIDGFTVTVSPRYARRLRVGRRWILKTHGGQAEVHAEWFFHAPEGAVQMGLRRMRDLTPSEQPRRALFFGCRADRQRAQSSSGELCFAGIVLLLFLMLSLPGLGEQMGTAPRIRGAVHTIFNTVRGLIP